MNPTTQTAAGIVLSPPASRVHVAFVVANLHGGGAQRVMLTLMNHLDRTRYKPELIVVNDEGPLRDWVSPDVGFHALGHLRVRQCILHMYRVLRHLKPLVVISTQAHLNLAVLLLRGRFPQTRFIVRETNAFSAFSRSVPLFGRGVVSLAYRRLYDRADAVVCPSASTARELADACPSLRDRLCVLYNPVDELRLRARLVMPACPPERESTVRFIAVGRCHKQKGYDRLIASLPDFNPDREWRLDIYGEGSEQPGLESRVCELGLQSRVRFHGFADDPWSHMAAADCLLLPSRWEGLPNVVLESLACGTPVIAHVEAGGSAEIAKLSRPGAVRVANDMRSFADAMREVMPTIPSQPRASLMPATFRVERVMAEFERILAGAQA